MPLSSVLGIVIHLDYLERLSATQLTDRTRYWNRTLRSSFHQTIGSSNFLAYRSKIRIDSSIPACPVSQLRHPADLVRSRSTFPISMTFKMSLERGHTVSYGKVFPFNHYTLTLCSRLPAPHFISHLARKSPSRKSPRSITPCSVYELYER